MSYDRKLEQVCPHLVSDEALFIGEDRLTLRPLRPISSINSVKVKFNRLLDAPSVGSTVGAKAKGSAQGPFNIRAGVNDTLILSVDDKPYQTLVAPSGNQLMAKQLATALNSNTRNVVFSVSRKGQIQITSRSLGAASRLRIRADSTLTQTLGLTVGKVYRGQQVMPGWSLVNDPNTLEDRPTRLIVFDSHINGSNDFFELNYSTIRQECRRCGGLGIENDWRYDARGEVIKVRNTDLLMQEVTKLTYTEKGSNPFHTWYGTGILEAVGQKLSERGLIQNMIVSDIREAFTRWQSVKRQQEEAVGQFVSDEEFPFQMLSLNLQQDSEDPTIVYVNATIQSRSSRPIQLSRGLRLPLPFDLLGSSVQDTLLRTEQARSLGPHR